MATPIQWGTEFLVNTTTADSQLQPTLTALADGRFVAAWVDYSATGGDTSVSAVRAQIFNANGSLSGAEFLLNSTTTDYQANPTLTALTDGRFVAAWSDYSQTGGDTSGYAVRAQIFNADGSPSGAEFLINATTSSDQLEPVLTTLTDGRFVAAWSDASATGSDSSSYAVRAQIFNADGSRSGAEFLMNSTTTDYQAKPTLTALANGRFVAAWSDYSQAGADSSGYAVRAQIFNADGSPSGAEFLMNSTTASDQLEPELTTLTDGRFVAAWSDASATGIDSSSYAVRAQIFNADGSRSGSEFLMNSTTTDYQSSPTLTALTDGRFVAAWSDYSMTGVDATDYAVRAQLFNADGNKNGSEFIVNSTTAGAQVDPAITSLPDGRFVVTWMDWSLDEGDTDGQAVRAQIFDPREGAIDLSGSALADEFVGTRWSDSISGGYGNDTLWGSAGHDTIQGGAGADSMIGGAGNDVYFVDSVNDWVIENPAEGKDTVLSALQPLDLANFANVENAQLIGQRNLDLTGNNGANVLVGNGGTNLIIGKGGHDAIHAMAGNDTVFGGNGNDVIEGGSGSDTLNGGAGQDTLFGGAGKDRLIGGASVDVFAFRSNTEAGNFANRDVIVDFTSGLDKIDLSAIDANEPLTGNQAFSFIGSTSFSGVAGELRYNAGNGRLMADTDGDGAADFQLQLIGNPPIMAADFVL